MSKSTDANDYSRFKDIVDSDEEKDATASTSKKAANTAVSSPCRNCSKADAKLKCSICKKATYCNRQCQTGDWTYHRRICKKPEDKAKADDAARSKPRTVEGAAAAASGSSSSSSTSSRATTKATKPVRRDVVKEDEDLENARGYKNGMPYFHREQSEHEKSLIGDIAPKKIEVEPTLGAAPSATHDGSAWNTAGTFEQRDFTTWATDRLKALLGNLEVTARSFAIRGGNVKDVKGDASVCVVRGKKRFLFDFEFNIEWTVVGKDGYNGKLLCHDISNDGDYEITVQYKKKPSDALEFKELAAAVNGQAEGFRHAVLARIATFVTEYQAL
ncbi:hypothetical protein DYB37_008130 [Aphanomyces astaci]|uniref:MYND-type domain-containing protein n=2 Tax=Aphanomyces astaci TaxID=112090 RepID=A0A3R7B5F8_APHAT|nr:hypothetical protein DYB35_007679 [Aphanomyces astaci]RHZ28987.1 hypothetical protein DYB37_008130 [Aphanomyces astaci]